MVRDGAPGHFNLAYVMTHYPRVALTYIAGEVDEVENGGGRIFPIAMNRPDQGDLTTEEARQRECKTLYLKTSPAKAAADYLGCLVTHPIETAKLTLKALRSARSDVVLMAKRIGHLCYAATAARHCREKNIRHLHAQFGLSPATIAWFACDILNFDPRVRCTWSFTIHGFHDFVDETVARLDLKAASASFVICVSDFTKSQLCRVSDPQYWDRFHVVRCGIDLAAFPERKPRPMRAVPRIAIVGRLSPEKGHAILLAAVRKLVADKHPVEIEIIGDGPFRDAVRRQAETLGVSEHVIFDGELLPDDVSARLADADIFCMASFAEGLPISIMEAMAVGVPVVSTWVGGIPELARNEVTAMTVPPGNSDALAAAIKRLATDAALCDRLTDAGRRIVENLHSRSANGAQLVAIYRSLLAELPA